VPNATHAIRCIEQNAHPRESIDVGRSDVELALVIVELGLYDPDGIPTLLIRTKPQQVRWTIVVIVRRNGRKCVGNNKQQQDRQDSTNVVATARQH